MPCLPENIFLMFISGSYHQQSFNFLYVHDGFKIKFCSLSGLSRTATQEFIEIEQIPAKLFLKFFLSNDGTPMQGVVIWIYVVN